MPGGPGESEPAGLEPESTRAMDFLRGPAVPGVREAALVNRYTLTRDAHNGVVVTRAAADGAIAELAASNRRLGVNWPRLAKAILDDALDGRPTQRLTEHYARFIMTPRAGARTIAAPEIQTWLDTWRPGLSAMFTSGR